MNNSDFGNFIDDMSDIFDNVQANEHDTEVLNNILSNISCYDTVDLICKLSSMNLVPYNQNKSLIFDKIIDFILLSYDELPRDNNIMSLKKFKQVVDLGLQLTVAHGIDPIEMPFMQRIQFYGNKWVFSGINTAPAYILQNFIDVICKKNEGFDQRFIVIANRILHLILEVSTIIVERLGFTNSVFNHHEKSEIVYPQTAELNKLSQSIIFDENDFEGIFDDNLRKIIYFSKETTNGIKIEYDSCFFYYCPFLKLDNKKFAVLNPTMLAPFAIFHILRIATDFGCRDKLVNLYNDKTWYECNQSLKMLGHRKLNENALGIELINNDYYKESLYSISNDGILFVRFFCDNAQNFDFSNMFSVNSVNVSSVETRWKDVLKLETVFKKDKVYQLTVINSLGRSVNLEFSVEPYHKNVSLSPFELYCVSINEQKHPNFLMHYIESKQRICKTSNPFVEEINYLALYTDNYSFYFTDETDSRTTILFPGYGDSVDYINKALLSLDKQLAEFPNSIFLREIVLNDPVRKIYCTTDKNDFSLLNRFSNLDIWVTTRCPVSVEEIDLFHSVLDLITYWLGECKSIVEKSVFLTKSILIKNNFSDTVKDYYLASNVGNGNVSTYLSSKTEGNVIEINWTPQAFLCFANKDKKPEKELTQWILSLVSYFSVNDLNFDGFQLFFDNPQKTKMFALDYMEHPYFKPMWGTLRHISVEYENQLLDEIGDYLRVTKRHSYGIISRTERKEICNDIVGFLYNKLQSEVRKFKPDGFYESLYIDLEQIIYSMMTTQRRYASDIACYPEHIAKFDSEYNETNKSSIATKFLLEYIAAIPPSGDVPLGECDYEYMLTICSLIIEWAHNSDMFVYQMIDNDLEILQSGRVGLKKDRIEELSQSNYNAGKKRLNALSNPSIDIFTTRNSISNTELDSAYKDEFSYTFTELNLCMFSLINIGDSISDEVKKINKESACEIISKDTSIKKEIVDAIIMDMSLSQREDYLTPPAPFSPNDVFPWKFNRRLSFIRRPITIVNNDLIWGNRQLYHSLRYLFELITSSRLPVNNEHGKLKRYLGKLINERGNDFNNVVADKLKTFHSMRIDSKVKKINGKRIEDQNKNDLGDIDVLAILPSKKKIVVFEAKDFSFAKTPYEMYQQYLSIFQDNGKKPCYLSKHKRRVEWVRSHMDDVISQYNLEKCKWKVVDALIVDESIISNEFFHQNQTILLYSELTEEAILRIK